MAEANAIATDSTDFLQAARAHRFLVNELDRAGFTNEGVTLFVPTNMALYRSMQSGAPFVIDDAFLRNHIFPGTLTVDRLLEVTSITSWGGVTFEVRSERGSVNTNNRRRSESFISIGNGHSRSFLQVSDIQGGVLRGVLHTVDRPLLPDPTSALTTAGPGNGIDSPSADSSNTDSMASNSELLIVGSLILALLLLVVCLAMFIVCRPPPKTRTGLAMVNGQFRSPSADLMHQPSSDSLVHPPYPQFPQGRWQWQDQMQGDIVVGPLTTEDDLDMDTALTDALQLGDDDDPAAVSPGLMPADYLTLASPSHSPGHRYLDPGSGFTSAQMPTWTRSPEPDYIGIASVNPHMTSPAAAQRTFEGPPPQVRLETRQSMIRDAAARWGSKRQVGSNKNLKR